MAASSSPVFKKLNLKEPSEIVVLNAPASFEPEIESLSDVAVRRSLQGVRTIEFALVFVMTQAEVDARAAAVTARAAGDAIVWFAYPKKSSRTYRSELDRDHAWGPLGAAGFEPVRMVAIDEDWSAVRFRRAEHIKVLTRGAEHTLSKAGAAKAGKR